MLAADGAGRLTGAGVRTGRADHPVCGDVISLDVRLSGGVIEELAWRARGCPACMAVTAAAAGALRGVSMSQAALRLRQQVERLGGLAPHERHAERLLLQALSRAE